MKNYVKPMSALVAMSMEENIAKSGLTYEGGQLIVTDNGKISNSDIALSVPEGANNNEKMDWLVANGYFVDGKWADSIYDCMLVNPKG